MAQNAQISGSRNGLIIGKFMPLTKGHCYLIDSALLRVEQLTILVCSLKSEPIDGHLRYEWVQETYPQCNVIHVTKELPSYPEEHPDFWQLWRECILAAAPKPDALFTSEEYGDRLAQELGCRHVCIDLGRGAVPISATKVRVAPLQNWEYIPAAVRPYYVKRILLIGPESTGKSTLALQLAQHYRTVYVPEYAREYLSRRGDLDGLEYEDITRIAAGQLEAEEQAARLSNRLLFCDTDLITTCIYSNHYFGKCPHWVQRTANERRYNLYLLTDIDLPWQIDPQRDLENRRQEFASLFRKELDSRRIRYKIVAGINSERLKCAMHAVDEWLRDVEG